MEYDPHLLLEGIAISSYAIGANLAFIYIRGEFAWIADILNKAIDEAKAAGLLGDDILGKGFACDIIVHLGAGALCVRRRDGTDRIARGQARQFHVSNRRFRRLSASTIRRPSSTMWKPWRMCRSSWKTERPLI
jgi:hypothetical protein